MRVATGRGYEITLSPDQEVLVEVARGRVFGGASVGQRAWAPANSVGVGTVLVIANNRGTISETSSEDFERGWLLGQVTGNGGHNPNNSSGTYLRFWMPHHADLADRADRIIRTMGVSRTYSGGAYNEIHRTLSIQTRALEDFVAQFLESKSKLIKPQLIEANASLVRGFLRGFFDADGTVSGNREKGQSVRLNQSSRPNLIAVQRMLLRFGIASTICLRRNAGTSRLPNSKREYQDYQTKANYELIVSKDNIGVFEHAIGFEDREKKARLAEFTRTSARKPYAERFTANVTAVETIAIQTAYEAIVQRKSEVDGNGFRIRL
ncbi:LAGLIDADG family homing endonuclease [Rhizobium leguminosarum]|uniref:LAGLIDADG family homing endonuclease n=1 Tax=Rhizobium leguminosarum TaxID=384 RepID=UPI0013F23149|nr:LAGLIDADG family homing endonuclease [Rhizobium leguminosarum]